ncbi:unnamed protein product [Rotaria sp. Silwood1]|nr:unnamed protein product [Rotaria sp. Silwood1]CAF1365671.1 unnamed protein product [Rotaria sp. Silwood1]CAF1652134.1 unnamed protein product [Rotaria sp. Silwood1]CAF1652143.1 unnamed protein product [Rotaria sp. Silwood1]CAF3444101.1 unnamed protein product [Rotaria sp. Silwood1]
MGLVTITLPQILPLFPIEIHEKTKEIYKQIPETLLKFLDLTEIVKTAECREFDLHPNTYTAIGQREYWANLCQASNALIPKNIHRQNETKTNPTHSNVDQSKGKSKNQVQRLILHDHKSPVKYNNKHANNLRTHLFNSIRKIFREQKIIEITPDVLADQIVRKCLELCPDWGEKQCRTSSTVVRSHITDVIEQESTLLNMTVYVYAHLMYEYQRSFLPWKKDNQPKIGYDLTIELSAISIDCMTLIKFCELVAENDVSDVIKIIEETNPTMISNDLNSKDFNLSPDKKIIFTWDSLQNIST